VPPNTWHNLVITSEWLVFYEVKPGPFQPSDSEFPSWAPDQNDPAAAPYLEALRSRIDEF